MCYPCAHEDGALADGFFGSGMLSCSRDERYMKLEWLCRPVLLILLQCGNEDCCTHCWPSSYLKHLLWRLGLGRCSFCTPQYAYTLGFRCLLCLQRWHIRFQLRLGGLLMAFQGHLGQSEVLTLHERRTSVGIPRSCSRRGHNLHWLPSSFSGRRGTSMAAVAVVAHV